MNSTILRHLAFYDRAYAICMNMLKNTKDEYIRECRRKDAVYWIEEKENFLSRAKDTLTDDEYIKLTIY